MAKWSAEEKTITTGRADWSRLSDRAAWTVVNVEMPFVFRGTSYAALAKIHGIEARQIRRLRRELQEELAAQQTTRDAP